MLNVMLMLSRAQPPDPQEEVQWHMRNLESQAATYFASPQALRTLSRGTAVVFYGDGRLGNCILAIGRFCGTVEIRSRSGLEIAEKQVDIYGQGQLALSAKTWVGVDQLHVDPTLTIEALGGTIESGGASHGLPLRTEYLPSGQTRRCVFFTTPESLWTSIERRRAT